MPKIAIPLDVHDHEQLVLLSRLKHVPVTKMMVGIIRAFLDREPLPRPLPAADVDQVLDAYSTPGLRKHELDPFGKREQLGSLGVKGADAMKILDQLYGPPPAPAIDQDSLGRDWDDYPGYG